MQIKFLDETTVLISEKLHWEDGRPENPIVVRKESIVADFSAENPSYLIKDVSGPSKICNFRREEGSFGEWTLKVEKKKKVVTKKVVTKKSTTFKKKEE